MDQEYSVFSILPPYNVIYSQLIDSNGKLVVDATGITVTYEGVADPNNSINTTSIGKTDFWQHVQELYGSNAPPDSGIAGNNMPGSTNQPQKMTFDAAKNWFAAEGIPLTPYDDAHAKNTYPLMRLVARDASNNILATTKIVLPVSDEMDCRACHASNSTSKAMPTTGWVNNPDPTKDYKQNILLLHDNRYAGNAAFISALAAKGYNAAGLYATATGAQPKAILCAACHASNALPGTGIAGISQLTQAVHAHHATVADPLTGLTLDSSDNRATCYRCHPGSTTACLRGVMGTSKNPDGTLSMQCQSCHGSMGQVGAQGRSGWLSEPNCQACHTGTATSNSGQIRFQNVFEATGQMRAPLNRTFATDVDVPATGFSLFRFSFGHGKLACEACHGSTHAEYPSSHPNDNIQSQDLQGHAGELSECNACHIRAVTANGGPHGLHTIGQSWVGAHGDQAQNGSVACQACHGTDYRGTVLSKVRAPRVFSRTAYAAGTIVSCFDCHNGPSGEGNGQPPPPPVDLFPTWNSLVQSSKKSGRSTTTTLKGSLKVQNGGTGKSRAAKVDLWLTTTKVLGDPTDLRIGKLSVSALSGGQIKALKINLRLKPGTITTGKYVIANVDAANLIKETNKSNNTAVFGPLP